MGLKLGNIAIVLSDIEYELWRARKKTVEGSEVNEIIHSEEKRVHKLWKKIRKEIRRADEDSSGG